MAEPAEVKAVLVAIGVDTEASAAALTSPEIKDRFRQRVDGAIAAGVCGSPYFIVDGEPFWGVDRLPDLEAWIDSGGW